MSRRRLLSRRIRWLVTATISYNVLEAVVALTEGSRVSSSALIGFGLDSVIEVSSAADGGSAVIRVTDTGIGVPGSDQKELFNRFFRASNATGRSIPGTGLGLAIVRMIVVTHGGDIGLESREGAGTTVTIRLPLLAEVAA